MAKARPGCAAVVLLLYHNQLERGTSQAQSILSLVNSSWQATNLAPVRERIVAVDCNFGFNALLSGNRDADGRYSRLDAHGFYWSATEGDAREAWFLNFGKGSQSLYHQSGGDKSRAWSVRCVKALATSPRE